MARQDGVAQWLAVVATHLPHLRRPPAAALARWSDGIALARCCGLTTVAAFLAVLRGEREGAVRERLRDWYRAAGAKQGAHRRAVEVAAGCAPLLRWVAAWWAPGERQLVLALAASTLGDRFTVLAVSVAYRGGAIPVAWAVLPATRPGAWRPHWERLLPLLAGAVPGDGTVLVAADRGRSARWRFRARPANGWHPCRRRNRQGQVKPLGAAAFRPRGSLVPACGRGWRGRVTCVATRDAQRDCTLVARRDAGHADPWLVLADLPPEVAAVAWYGLRTWVAQGGKDRKRGGWQWQQTRMADPARVARRWLARAVATLWAVSVGGEADAPLPASSLDALPATHLARRLAAGTAPRRRLSCLRRGVTTVRALRVRGLPLPQGRLRPEPWPAAAAPRQPVAA